MATPQRKRKRDFQEDNVDDFSFIIASCGLRVKRRKKTVNAPMSAGNAPRTRSRTQELNKENMCPGDFTPWKPPTDIKPIFTPPPLRRSDTWKGTLQRKVSLKVMRRKLKSLQDYSLPYDSNFQYLDQLAATYRSRFCSRRREDHDLQQKIDHEIKMREGTVKLLAASKHPAQMLEAAKNLLTSNTRIMSYMTELQKRKTDEVLGKTTTSVGNQLPCKAKVSISDIRIPLMWKDSDHFKNKGDYRRYAIFCLLKIGTDIFETSMINNVDRSMTDLTFEGVSVYNNVPHDFTCKFDVYCHKLHEDLTIASTPKKLRKKINDLSGSVGRSVGKRLSGLNDADIIGNMVLGPRFELMASGTMDLSNVSENVGTFDLQIEPTPEGAGCELPLFGVFCCRLAAQPECLTNPTTTGYLNLLDDEDKVKRYWCILKNLKLACWSSPSDVEVTEPLLTIPVTKNTQISEASPPGGSNAFAFHIKTSQKSVTVEHTLAAASKEELGTWWDGLQQHLLDQALWKHACDHIIPIRTPSPRKKPAFLRKSSLYEDTPLKDAPSSRPNSVVGDLQMEDDQLNKMLSTLMGEAKQIRGDNSYSTTV